MAREWTTGIDVLRMEKFLLLVRRMLGASFVWMQVRETKKTTNNKKRTASGKSKNGTTAAADDDSVRFDAQRVEVVLALLADWPFRPDEESRREEEEDDLMPKQVPVGLKLHALDIWVDEAEKAGLLLESEDDDEEKKTTKSTRKTAAKESSLTAKEVLQRINDLVDKLNAETLSKAVRIRSKESLADDRLPWNEKEEGEKDDGEWGGLDD